jgi:hypothetical protein
VPAKVSLWILAIQDWEQEEWQFCMDPSGRKSKTNFFRREIRYHKRSCWKMVMDAPGPSGDNALAGSSFGSSRFGIESATTSPTSSVKGFGT